MAQEHLKVISKPAITARLNFILAKSVLSFYNLYELDAGESRREVLEARV